MFITTLKVEVFFFKLFFYVFIRFQFCGCLQYVTSTSEKPCTYQALCIASATADILPFSEKQGGGAVRCKGKIFMYGLILMYFFYFSHIFISKASLKCILGVLKSDTEKAPKLSAE